MARRRSQRAKDIKLAKARAKVRYGAERQTIGALLGEAKTGLASDLSSADAAAKSAVHFAKKAEKPVARIYNQARTEADTARQDVATAFGQIGAGADPFRAVTAREQGGRLQRIAGAGASALNDLRDRQLEAVAGGQYAREQAKAEFRKSHADLLKRKSDLDDRIGAFVAQEAGSIADKRAGRKATTRNTRLGIRGRKEAADTAYARDVAKIKLRDQLSDDKDGGGKGLPKGVKPASRSELRMFKTDFAKALSYAKQFKAQGNDRHTAANTLISGAPASKEAGGVPSIDDQLALSVALDMVYDTHVSRPNARTMRQAGIRVRDVPSLISYKQWTKKRTPGKSSGGGGGPRGSGRL